MDKVEELKRLLEKATARPWAYRYHPGETDDDEWFLGTERHDPEHGTRFDSIFEGSGVVESDAVNRINSELIVALVNNADTLLEIVEAAEQARSIAIGACAQQGTSSAERTACGRVFNALAPALSKLSDGGAGDE
ncbi:MAG: hypothetical protein AAGK02_07205 [Pseudomonadota bacterium]